MTDAESLRDRIRTLADAGDSVKQGRRLIASDETSSLRCAFHKEISETHLGRKLEFQAGDTTLTLAARAGRVLAVLSTSLPHQRRADHIGVPLNGSDERSVLSASDVCERFVRRSPPLFVNSLPLPPEIDGPCAGVPPELLASPSDLESLPDWLLRLLEETHWHVIAKDGAVIADGHPGQPNLALMNLAEEELALQTAGQQTEETCSAVVVDDGIGSVLVCAASDCFLVVAITTAQKLPNVLSCWSERQG